MNRILKSAFAFAVIALPTTSAVAGSWGWRGHNTGVAAGEGRTKGEAYSDLERAAVGSCRSKGFNRTPDIEKPQYTYATNPAVRAYANVTCY